jgi:Bax protein
MHNLNTHNAYQNLRIERQKYREGDQNILTQRLIPTLDKYAQDGDIYIRKLQNIVRTNNLQIYDNAVLVRTN